MKIFSSDKIREIDEYTIKNEPVKSVDLMERAARALFLWFADHFERSVRIKVFTGPGNNGGDGLAMARLLADSGYNVEVFHVAFTENKSKDWKINYDRLKAQAKVRFNEIKESEDFPVILSEDIIVDAIFGSGLSRPAEDFPGEVIKMINAANARLISIDIPSGLFGEDNTANNPDTIVRADYTLSLQFPKLSFFFAENQDYVGEFSILPIGLHKSIINSLNTDYRYTDIEFVAGILNDRRKFDHKGNFGHGLMVAGSCGKAGASVLSSHAALRTGIGLLTVHVPKPVAEVIHTALPEAMVQCDQSEIMISHVYDTNKYDAIGIGPGLGTKPNTRTGLRELLKEYKGPMVLDADALNIISEEKDLAGYMSGRHILTPHPGEFRRLAGSAEKEYKRLLKLIELSEKLKCVIVLKGAYTSVCLPDGRVWFNSTGNPGMATAGSGDVLTGMILSFLAQGYSPDEAAIAGVFVHGLAADIASELIGYEALLASDIINNIGNSFKQINKWKNNN